MRNRVGFRGDWEGEWGKGGGGGGGEVARGGRGRGVKEGGGTAEKGDARIPRAVSLGLCWVLLRQMDGFCPFPSKSLPVILKFATAWKRKLMCLANGS